MNFISTFGMILPALAIRTVARVRVTPEQESNDLDGYIPFHMEHISTNWWEWFRRQCGIY